MELVTLGYGPPPQGNQGRYRTAGHIHCQSREKCMMHLACLLVLGSSLHSSTVQKPIYRMPMPTEGLGLPTSMNSEDNSPIGQPVLDSPSWRLSS